MSLVLFQEALAAAGGGFQAAWVKFNEQINMKKNVASQSIGAQMITAADGTAFTGSVSVLYTIDNGTQTAGGGTAPAHEGNGYHSYTPLQAETNGDHIAFTFTGTGAIPQTIQATTNFPQSVDNAADISAILIDTSEIGVAGAGLTNIGTIATVTNLTNLPVAAATAAALATAQADLDIITGADGVNLLSATQATIDAIPTAAEVNAEIVDVLTTDTFAEPSSVPSATSSLKDKISYVFTLLRNKMTQTATTTLLRNDADSATISTSTVSDDATTFTRGKQL